MTCVISFRWHQSVLFVANILVNDYVAEETAGQTFDYQSCGYYDDEDNDANCNSEPQMPCR